MDIVSTVLTVGIAFIVMLVISNNIGEGLHLILTEQENSLKTKFDILEKQLINKIGEEETKKFVNSLSIEAIEKNIIKNLGTNGSVKWMELKIQERILKE